MCSLGLEGLEFRGLVVWGCWVLEGGTFRVWAVWQIKGGGSQVGLRGFGA